jgi:[acyl-carrier-protein] S-malonyltransferase
MAAIVGMEDEAVRELCKELLASDGVVVPANFNSPGQLVISGDVAAIRKAVEVAKTRGAKLARELPVSGAFHSPLMQPAADALTAALAAVELQAPRFPVISNVTAEAHTDAASLRRLLASQLLSPVRWTESQQVLASEGDARWFEVGSGSVLAGLLKRTVKGVAAQNVGSVDDLHKLGAAVGGVQ